jgi:hypothetical protein
MRRALLPVIAVGAALALAACSGAGMPVPESTGSSSPSVSAKPLNKPKFDADGTPKENLPYFLSVMNTAYANSTGADTVSEEMAAYLVNAGFDAASMQISENTTALGLVPDAKYVATIFKGECMVGTWGSSMAAPTAIVLAVLPQGGCLLGGTVRSYQG